MLGKVNMAIDYLGGTVSTEYADIIRRSMVCANHTSVGFRLTITIVINRWRERSARGTSPVVVRNEIVIFVPTSLRLLVDDSEDLVNSIIP